MESEVFSPYWAYHVSGAKRLIERPQDAPKGEGWGDRPFPVEVKAVETLESVKAQLEEARAGLAKLRQDLAAAVSEKDQMIGRFNANWSALTAERDALKAERDQLLAEKVKKSGRKPTAAETASSDPAPNPAE